MVLLYSRDFPTEQNIATPPNYNFSERHVQCRFGVAFQPKSHISPLHYPRNPPPPHSSCMHLVAHNHACMPVIFRSAYLSSQNTGEYMYSLKIPIPYPFFRSSISYPFLTATQYFWPRVTPHKPLFDFYHSQLQHLFPLSVFTSITLTAPYTLLRWR